MIVVIADDFTGGAELGGIGLRYGLNCEIHTEVPKQSEAELLIIAKNTRSMSREEAFLEITKILKRLHSFPIEWIYKKTDSILRGHVFKEIEAVSKIFNNDRVLLIPANPSLGRTILNGIYFIDGQPLHETDLRYDLLRGGDTSNIINLLEVNGEKDIYSLKLNQSLSDYEFVIGDATNVKDLKKWAKKGFANHRILAGAADFFTALLQMKGYKVQTSQKYIQPASAQYLFVCGSPSNYSKSFILNAVKEGYKISPIPTELFDSNQPSEDLINQWAVDVIEAFSRHQKVITTINKPLIKDANLSKRLRCYMANLVEKVLKKFDLEELFIEGGATASSIVERLQFKKFFPLQEFAPGVVRMNIASKSSLNLTIKPGSYAWPDKICNHRAEN